MSAILIPSKKIYNISHTKLPNNTIGKVELSYNSMQLEYGNILDQEYSFVFFDISGSIPITLFNVPHLNHNVRFQAFDTQNGGKLVGKVRFKIDKLVRFQYGTNEQGKRILTSHKLKVIKTITYDSGQTLFEEIQDIEPVVEPTEADLLNGFITVVYETVIEEDNKLILSERVSLVGNYFTPVEQTLTVGEGSHLISIPSNELMQDENVGLTNYANEIISHYANGKETATIRCSIGDYYDTENGLIISTKTNSKMTFEIGDKTVPMVRIAYGKDAPLSCYSNGLAKVFEVAGTKFYYDGSVWQELTLRETGEGLYIYVTENPYLTFSSSEEFTLETRARIHYWDGIIEYSTDLTNWAVWNGETIISSQNGKLYLRGIGNRKITGGANSAFKLTGSNIDCKGNIETLLDYQTVKRGEHPEMYTRCFYCLFLENDALIGVPSLPATNLAYGCYEMMFRECTNLAQLPNLPAKELPSECYSNMFLGCPNIKISTTKSNEYSREYRIPLVGDATVGTRSLAAMFTSTGGEFKGTPEINTTYYTSNKLV